MRIMFIFSLILLSNISVSQTLEDVIYKKDGSILRGQLIEQDFQNERYKIQLQGGSVFVVTKEDISKITKEAKMSDTTTQIQPPPEPVKPRIDDNTLHIPLNTQPEFSPSYRNTFFIGRHFHEISEPYDYGYGYGYYSNNEITENQNFRGFRLGYQRVHSKHIATIYAVESAKLDSVTVEDDKNDIVYAELSFESTRYLGLNAAVILSTKLQKGWQFYIGAGVYHNRYFRDSGDTDDYGTTLDLGMGYSWYNWQLLLRADTDISNQMEVADTDIFSMSIDLGYNY